MDTRTGEMIEQTLRDWDDYAAIEQEERLECVLEHVERERARHTRRAPAFEAQARIAPGTTSNAYRRAEPRHGRP